MRKRLLVVGSKGSSGKSTLVLALCKLAQLTWKDCKTAIVDLDFDQYSSTQFSKMMNLELVHPDDAHFVFVDGAAKLKGVGPEASKADKIVLACVPGPLDVPVNQNFCREELAPYADKTRILYTRVKTVSRMDMDIVQGQNGFEGLFAGFQKLQNFMHEWQDYRNFALTGDLTPKIKNELSSILLEIQL